MKLIGLLLFPFAMAMGELSSDCRRLLSAFEYYHKDWRSIPPDQEKKLLRYDAAQYEILITMEYEGCLEDPLAEEDGNIPNGLFVDEGCATAALSELRGKYAQQSRVARRRFVEENVCRKKYRPKAKEPERYRDGVDYFCRDMRDLNRYRDAGLPREYTWKNALKGDHHNHIGPPVLATGITQSFQMLFDHLSRRSNFHYAHNLDTYYTHQRIHFHKFAVTNCLDQHTPLNFSSNFHFNFLDSQGNPLSTDGQSIRSDLSNWDFRAAGNFTGCGHRRDSLITPFSLGIPGGF